MAKPQPARQTFPRSSGLLLHITSLPGPYGIGDLGPAARHWVDQLAEARQTWWQILPLTPPTFDSPYTSLSAMAGNPLLLSPDELVRDGLLRPEDLPRPMRGGRVDYPAVIALKRRPVEVAFERYRTNRRRWRSAFDRFRHEHRAWLDDYALFVALRDAHGGRCWTTWPRDLARRRPDALRSARRELAEAIERQAFAQFLFFRQLEQLRTHARQRGIRLIGDVPIFVAHDSADVWSSPHLFQLDRNFEPKAVAGVPPDYFSTTGQRWGNPLYDWRAMQRDGFDWWIRRFRAALSQVDVVRIDHFRGFDAYWSVPASAPTARSGRWVKAPGNALFQALEKAFAGRGRPSRLPFIAEDLGVITPDVEKLRDDFGLPGMRVLQFAFAGSPADPFLPHNYIRNAVAYTGTHDNDTTVGWYRSLKPAERRRVHAYLGEVDAGSIGPAMIRAVWGSVADLAIAPVQDLIGLDSECRMNLPGACEHNWAWRLPDRALKPRHLKQLRQITELYNRAPATADTP